VTAPVLEADGICKSFGDTHALRDVSLEARPGEIHAVLGENGAGKSTLMKTLAGAIVPDAGTMRLGGDAFAPRTPSQARAGGVAIVYQEPQLCPHLDVAENIALGAEPTKGIFIDRKQAHERANEALGRLLGDAAFPTSTLVSTLPPGDRQLVAIARALSQTQCQVLILDEPTSSLTARDAERLFAALEQLKADGMCILYISHYLEEVERIADRFTVLRDGQTVGTGNIADTSLSDIVRLMAGGDVDDLFPRSEREVGDEILALDALKGFRQPVDASLSLRTGEVLGIAGLVGSGRTELLRAIFGLDPVRSGEIRVRAIAGPASPAQRLSEGVGMLSEDRKHEGLAATMSIADNLTLSRLDVVGPLAFIPPAKQRGTAARWIDRLGIRCRDSSQPVSDLSGGNQQKVALARLLHHDVDVLLLDEPTRGIDIRSRAAIYKLIDDLARKGRAILVVSSYLPELFGICDRIAVMQRGTLGPAQAVADTDPHRVLTEATGA
jgi:ribose transport system ATP-binding protein